MVYLAAGWAMLAAAARWVVPVPTRARIILLAVPLVLSAGALATDSVFAPANQAYNVEPFAGLLDELGHDRAAPGLYTDVGAQIAPWRAAVRASWLAGRWPLWNPSLLCGDVLAGSAQSAPYYPLYLALIWLPLPLFLSVQTTLALFVAALGCWLLLSDLRLEETASLVGAAGWTLCGFMTFWVHWPLGVAAAWLPLVLLGARRLITRPGLPSAGLLTLVLTMVMLAGHPETAVHLVVFGVLWALVEWALARFRHPRRVLVFGVGAGAMTLALTAVYLLPVMDVLDQSSQYAARRQNYRFADRSVPWAEAGRHAIALAVPFVYGVVGGPQVDDVPHQWVLPATSYAGSVLLPFAAVGIAMGRDPRRWLILALGLLGALAGLSAPGVADLIARVPLFDISFNERLFFLGGFATSALAAFGVHEISRRGMKVAAVAALLVAVSLAVAVWMLWPGAEAAGFQLEQWQFRSAVLIAPLLILAVALVGVRQASSAAAVVLVLLVVQRGLEAGGTFPLVPAERFFPRVRPLDLLQSEAEPYRVVGLGYALLPATATYFGLEDVRGYQALHFERLYEVLDLYSVRQTVWFNRVSDLERPFLDFLNVRYALARSSAPVPSGWEEVDVGPNGRLLRNLEALPRAFAPRRVRRTLPGPRAVREMAAASEFATVAWIEDPSLTLRQGIVEEPNGPGTVSVTADGPHYTLRTELANEAWVVVSVPAWRGWRAHANGRPLRLAFANHAFLGIRAPAGSHEITVSYRPRSFVIGGLISVSALAGCGVVIVVASARRRRHSGRHDQARGNGGGSWARPILE